MRHLESAGRPGSRRGGFTLLEMLVTVVLLTALVGAALPFLVVQMRAVRETTVRVDAVQNARLVVNAVERDLRNAGMGIMYGAGQPALVQAGPRTLTFNADLFTSTGKSAANAVYVDSALTVAQSTVLRKEAPIKLPLSGASYPGQTYKRTNGLPGDAETISFWVRPDAATPRADDYVLYRRVNDADSTVVARGVVLRSADTLFTYYGAPTFGATPPPKDLGNWVTTSATDTTLRSIRSVRIRVRQVGDASEGADGERVAQAIVRIENAGLPQYPTCGQAPQPVPGLAVTPLAGGVMRLIWPQSPDEDGGEKDVQRYAVFRRTPAEPSFGEPIESVAAGLPTYTFNDAPPKAVSADWVYAVTAQDCTPEHSALASAPQRTLLP